MLICIKNATLISMSEKFDKIINDVDILIDNGVIVNVSSNILVSDDMKVIDAQGKIVMPGFINTHSHVPMSIFRETSDGYNLQDWLTKKIWPMEDKLLPADIYYASSLSFIEMIKSGTTMINDMYFMTDEIIKAALYYGIRLQTSRTLMGFDFNNNRLNEFNNIIAKDYGSLISYNMGIHGLYTCSSDYLDKCLDVNNNLPIHIHFYENDKEKSDIKSLYGMTGMDVLFEKFKNYKLLLAHGVVLSDEDIEKLSKLDVSISHCPISNLRLGCGVANIKKMIDFGINVSLGSDGAGSGSNLNMFEIMKITALLQKGFHKDSNVLNSYEVLKMATINGARALGVDSLVGSIEIGKRADIIILNMDDVFVKPTNDLISQIVYNCGCNNVESVIIDGKIVMENKKLVNDNSIEIINKCEDIIKRIC